ncbi:uncharacterized protein EV422DRAFT_510530, partial [Fimicolochytrium jonesii]|uniref:uncharacterized protein n=1 Tax=Fimicolochytrium jonesii TaxID=1396493 RepID=UPI0022FDC720
MSGLNSRNSSGLRNLNDTLLNSPYVSGNMKALSGDTKLSGFHSAEVKNLYNQNGELKINDLVDSEDAIIYKTNGTASIGVIPDNMEFPLERNDGSRTVSLVTNLPLGTLSESDEGLTVNFPPPDLENLQEPLSRDDKGIKLDFDEDSLEVNNGKLAVVKEPLTAPLTRNVQGISLDIDSTLTVENGQLSVVPENIQAIVDQSLEVAEPLSKDQDKVIHLNYGKGLKVNDEGKLETDIDTVIIGRGAISNDKGSSILLEDVLQEGFDSLADFLGDDTDVDTTVTGNKLAIRSKGMGQVPFYSALSGFNGDSSFTYNETLNELHVPHVYVNTDFNPDNNQVPSTAYVEQLYQAGSGIDISGVSNGRRTIDVRTDASLAIDSSQNLSVNPSAIVDNKGVRIVNDKIAIGLTFQPGNGGLKLENSNQVKLAPSVSGSITFDGNNTFGEKLTASNGVKRIENDLQLDLQAGDSTVTVTGNSIKGAYTGSNGVSVTGNTISGAYTAGNNISISGSSISCTYQPEPETPTVITGALPIIVTGADKEFNVSKQPLVITGGSGILVVGSEETGFNISSIQPYKNRKEDDDPEEKNEDSEPSGESDPLTASGSNPVVSVTGPLSTILGGAVGLIGPAAGAPFATSAIGSVGGLLGGPAAAAGILGGFIAASGRQRKNQKDANGNNVVDSKGNPVPDPNGSQVIIATFPKTDDTSCDVTRLLFDTPPPCSYLGIAKEIPQQAVNLDMLRQYDSTIIQPTYSNLIIQNTNLLQTAIDGKVAKTDTIPYARITGAPDLTIYEKKLTFAGPILSRDTSNTVSVNTGNITTLGTLTSLNVTGALTVGSISSPTLNNYLLSSVASTTYQPLNARLTNFGNIAPTNTYMLIASGGNFIQYSPADVRANLSLKNLSLLDTLDYTSSALVNKPTLGSLAALNVLDYTSASLTNKPSLGSLAAKSVINLASTDVTGILPFGSVDPNIVIAGTGLSKTAQTLSVNPVQTQITSVGTLTGLTVSGSSTFTGSITVPTPTTPSHAVTKSYVDGLISTTQTGAQPLNGKLTAISSSTATLNNFLVGDGTNFVSTTPSASRTALGLGSIALKNSIDLANDVGVTVLPYSNIDQTVAQKSYVDGLVSTAGTGLTKTGNVFSVNASQTGITSLGTLSSLSVGGNANIAGDVTVSGNVVVSTVPTLGTHLTNKTYVDTLLSAGTGLTRSGNSFSVNPAQPQITSVGTLSSLNVGGNANLSNVQIAGTTDSTSTTSGALQVVGGVGVGKSVVVGGTVFLGGTTANLNTTTGQTLNINNAASTVVTSTLDSNAINAGALQVAGGVGIAKSLYVGGYGIIKESTAGNGPSVGLINSNGGGWTLWHIGQTSGLGTNNFGLYNNTAANLALTVNVATNALNINSTTDSNGITTGALQVAGGVGIAKKLTVGSDASFVGSNQSIFWYNGSVSTPTFGSSITGNVSAAGYFSSNSAIGDM